MAYFAEFITARFQREIPMEVAVGVTPSSYLRVGQMVKVVDGVVKPLAASTEAAAKTEATHIIAQSDMTMEYGHVPVEYRDYRYSDQVKGTVSDETLLSTLPFVTDPKTEAEKVIEQKEKSISLYDFGVTDEVLDKKNS